MVSYICIRDSVYPYHNPYPYSHITIAVRKGIIISDYPIDYLTVYKNVHTTYSDRVHACIPTLSFGNYAQLFSRSPRLALFENVGLNEIVKRPVKISGLDEYQEKQVEFLKKVLNG